VTKIAHNRLFWLQFEILQNAAKLTFAADFTIKQKFFYDDKPITGTIHAGIFGGVVQDVPLTRKGIRNEIKASWGFVFSSLHVGL
jgi:hypothetical protein